MALKHRITINVSDPHGRTANVLKGADARLPARLIRFLFGDFQQVYLLSPGQTVESVDIHEVKEGGAKNVKDERAGNGFIGAETVRRKPHAHLR